MFSCEFCEDSKNTFYYRTPLVAASDLVYFLVRHPDLQRGILKFLTNSTLTKVVQDFFEKKLLRRISDQYFGLSTRGYPPLIDMCPKITTKILSLMFSFREIDQNTSSS